MEKWTQWGIDWYKTESGNTNQPFWDAVAMYVYVVWYTQVAPPETSGYLALNLIMSAGGHTLAKRGKG